MLYETRAKIKLVLYFVPNGLWLQISTVCAPLLPQGGARKAQISWWLLDQAALHHRSKRLHTPNNVYMVRAPILLIDSFCCSDSVMFAGIVQV